jgi:hypothetical protein
MKERTVALVIAPVAVFYDSATLVRPRIWAADGLAPLAARGPNRSPRLTEASNLRHRTFAPEPSSFFGVDKRGKLNLPLLQGYQESGGATNG